MLPLAAAVAHLGFAPLAGWHWEDPSSLSYAIDPRVCSTLTPEVHSPHE